MSGCRKRNVLLLDRDFRPILIICWKKAMKHLYGGKAETILNYLDHRTTYEPAVIKLLFRSVPPGRFKRKTKFYNRYVLYRDNYTCSYCGSKDRSKLTIDHILPKSRGGLNSYENTTTACFDCNQHKGNLTPQEAGMSLFKAPTVPYLGAFVSKETAPTEWLEYLKE